jgi:hypothetical protein
MCARSNLQRKFVVVLAAAMRNRLLATRSDALSWREEFGFDLYNHEDSR